MRAASAAPRRHAAAVEVHDVGAAAGAGAAARGAALSLGPASAERRRRRGGARASRAPARPTRRRIEARAVRIDERHASDVRRVAESASPRSYTGTDGQGRQARAKARQGAAGGQARSPAPRGARRPRSSSAAAASPAAVYEIGALRALDLLSVNRTVNQFDVYVGHQRRLVRRGAGGQRRDARGDDAGRQPAGADAVPRHRPRHAAAPQRARVAPRARRAAAARCAAAARARRASSGSVSCDGPRARARRGPARRRVLRQRHRALHARGALRPGPLRRLPPARARALPGGHRPRHVRAHRLRRRAAGTTCRSRTAVRASTALPMVYKPVKVRDRELVDGGIVSTTNLDIAVEAGAKFVVVVNPLVPYVNDFSKRVGTLFGRARGGSATWASRRSATRPSSCWPTSACTRWRASGSSATPASTSCSSSPSPTTS